MDFNTIREKLDATRPKKDYTVDPSSTSISPFTGRLVLNQGEFTLSEWATTQLCGKLKIPAAYYKNCPNDLRASNANYWLSKHKKQFMFRISDDDRCRAVLSTRYNSINNADLVDAAYSIINNTGKEVQVCNYWNDDLSFDIRWVFPNTDKDIFWGFHLTNSEVGFRRLTINTVLYNKNNNSSIIKPIDIDSMFNHKHMGETTIEKVGDALSNTIEQVAVKGDELIEQYERTKDITITEEEAKSIITGVKTRLNKSEKFFNDVTDRFNAQGGRNLFHLINAITTYADDLDIERRLDLEFEAGRLIDMY